MPESLIPYINIGPGEFIREELEIHNWSQEDFAKILGMSLKSVNKIIMNKQAITVETARLLSKVFGQSPQYWLALDNNYRLRSQQDDARAKEVEIKAKIYKYMPIKEMIKNKWLRVYKNIKDLEKQIKQFWEIKILDFSFLEEFSLPPLRKSSAFANYNKYYALTWFHMAKKCASLYSVAHYNTQKLQSVAHSISNYTIRDNGVEQFINDLNQAGVKFFVLNHLPKTYIDGASFFNNDNPVIVYTQRYNRIDNFWFTVAHELAHIKLHLKKKEDFFLDNIEDLNEGEEQEADQYAANLIKVNQIREFFKPYGNYISEQRVNYCAQELAESPAIIVGVLQHYGTLSPRNLNRLKEYISKYIPDYFYAENHLKEIYYIKTENHNNKKIR